MPYYCPGWTEHTTDDISGQTIGEIWNELCCTDWVGDETVYLNESGDVQDRGDLNNERCSHHGHGYWAENGPQEALNSLIEHGWYTCTTCDDALDAAEIDNTQVWYNEEMFLANPHEHIAGAQEVPPLTDIRTAPTTGDRLLTPQDILDAVATVETTPPPDTIMINPTGGFTSLPPRPTWPSPLDRTAEWHIEPPVERDIDVLIRSYLRGSYRTNYTEHPGNGVGQGYVGFRLNPDNHTFTLVRSEMDLWLVPATNWTVHRFMPGPARTTRSTRSMWETPA